MNQNSICLIGIKQLSREEVPLYNVSDVEGLIDTLDRDFSEWSDFDNWENIRVQQWIFERALDIYKGRKIDIKCACCECIYLSQIDSEKISNNKCFGIKSAYMIKKVFNEIVSAKARRESDGTYSA
tara:strand:+ start:142 stop:519 length:378 start_codon:yes stop_codon:yes gene_type:complete